MWVYSAVYELCRDFGSIDRRNICPWQVSSDDIGTPLVMNDREHGGGIEDHITHPRPPLREPLRRDVPPRVRLPG